MDENGPPTPPSDLLLRSASERTPVDIDPPAVVFAKSDRLSAIERQGRSGQGEPCRDDSPDGPSVAVYCRNEEEVRDGFLIALRAMGVCRCRTRLRANNPSRQGRKAVKASYFSCLLPICMSLFACGPTASRGPTDAITFDTAERLDDFVFFASGDGRPHRWSVIDNHAGVGLAQIASDPSENRLAFALYRPFAGRDVYVSTRFMTNSSKIDRAGGVFVRFRSPDDHYAARANALENNVTLHRIAAGRRELIGSMEVNVSGEAWHTLGIAARDDRLTVFFDGRELFVATDRRFPGPPGKVGLWTEAGSTTLFESLEVSTLH
jgi:hypothetical protein